MSGSQGVLDDFCSGSSITTETGQRDVTSVAVPSGGRTGLCHNGLTSHRECGLTVAQNDYCSGGVCWLIRITPSVLDNFDSGGPLCPQGESIGQALGIAAGYVINGSGVRLWDVYSQLDKAQSTLNVTILTN